MASRGVSGPIGDTDGGMGGDGRDPMFARSGASSDHDTRLVQAMDLASDQRATSRHCGKGKALVVFALAVLLATGIAVAIVFMDTTDPSPVFPESFTLAYSAYPRGITSANELSAQAVTGVAYKRPTESRRGMSVRLMGRYLKANGTIQSTTLVVDGHGVIQDHLIGNDGTAQDLLRTYCPSTSRMPSMAAVVAALEAATVVDAAGMAAVVGSSQCLGGQPAHRLVVKVGAVSYAVCVDSGMRHVELVGPAFFAVMTVSHHVSDADFESIALPTHFNGTSLSCPPLIDPDVAPPVTSSRRRRLTCNDCALDEDYDGLVHPPPEDCCERRRRRRLASTYPADTPAQCSRSPESSTKRCVFVHGINVADSFVTKLVFPTFYWGDLESLMSDYCKSVHFVLTETRSRGPLSTALAQDLAHKIKAVDGDVRDLLIFAHEAGNLMLANAINLGYLTLGSGTKWFEAQSSFPLSRLAAWGEHYCQHASMPSFWQFLFHSYYTVFNAGFPYCAGARRLLADATPGPATGDGALAGLDSAQRQLSIGSGHTNLAWQALAYSPSNDFSAQAAIVKQHVFGSMCASRPSNSQPVTKFWVLPESSPFQQQWQSYTNDNLWSRCWDLSLHSEFSTSDRSRNYELHAGVADAACRFGDAWYDPTVRPCSWYVQMACQYGGEA